ncbi:hypothetical protein A1O3_09625 [Capronia epimyces CBS 606.96]|uniref:Major facilitator superfamily (MFS) profile domain-containing protein n=1 Tax=Capronia epimyces CBS 606.96 TaxID=1182542 RepID=W9Y4N4_9EURO|nr:uncharacterized protein A1O3_09625 [Capronia epimyces CBS 606.96]EXJ77399.1 hypothetical protein A1O3_09625 [Capronia epimyces CBS 606.96]
MAIMKRSQTKDVDLAVGPALAALLPQNPKPWYRTRHLLLLNCILLIPWLSATAYGFDGSMMNGLQSLPQWRNYFDKPSSSILGTMNAVYPIGKFFGLFATAWLGDRYGRKLPMYFGFALLVVGAALQGAAQDVAMFIVARLLLGIGTAGVSQPAPILISELAYPTHRGRLTAMYYSTYYVGGIIAAWSTYGTFRMQNTWSWRIPSLLQGAVPLFQLCLLYFVPESPRFLISKGRTEEARRLFVKHHAGGDESSPMVAFEISEIQKAISHEKTIHSETSYLDLVRTKANRKRTLIAVIVGFYGTWAGVAVIAYYLTLVLDTIGITSASMQTLINAILNVVNFVVAVLSAALVDRIGRRPLWIWGVIGMFVSYLVWTVLSAKFQETHRSAYGNAVLVFIFLYKVFYDGCYSPMLLAYPIEIFPYTLRSRGLSASMATNQVALIMAQFVNPIALDAIGWKYYIVFCVLLLIFLALIYFFFPETKGRTLEEIAGVFEQESAALGQDAVKEMQAEAELVEVVEPAPERRKGAATRTALRHSANGADPQAGLRKEKGCIRFG